MSGDFHDGLEPFPLFIDSAPPNSANYFSSPIAMAAVQLLAVTSTSESRSYAGISLRKPRIAIPTTVSGFVRRRYYQYEVTFGLYMMDLGEKVAFNIVIFAITAAVLYAFTWGVQAFLLDGLCKLIFLATGSLASAPESCTT